jgi:hypothetical protein
MEFRVAFAMLDSPQQAEEVGASQLTRPPPVWTQPPQSTPGAGRATPAGGATPDVAGSSQAAMATPSPNHLGPRVVRAPDPRRTTGTRLGLALELLGEEGPAHLDVILLLS